MQKPGLVGIYHLEVQDPIDADGDVVLFAAMVSLCFLARSTLWVSFWCKGGRGRYSALYDCSIYRNIRLPFEVISSLNSER